MGVGVTRTHVISPRFSKICAGLNEWLRTEFLQISLHPGVNDQANLSPAHSGKGQAEIWRETNDTTSTPFCLGKKQLVFGVGKLWRFRQ